jgi:hypothetical protein
MRKRGYVEPTAEDVEISQPIHKDEDDEVRDLVHARNHLMDTSNMFTSMEENGFDVERNYDWSTRINNVSTNLYKKPKCFFFPTTVITIF